MKGTDIQLAAEYLLRGETVAIPTETVYGLAANALDEKAVARVFEVKQRPLHNPLIIHVADVEQITRYTNELPPAAQVLLSRFAPGPLTLLLPRNSSIPDIVTAGSPLVAVRIPDHPVTLELLRLTDLPLAAPSANPFGYISPTTAGHVEKMLGEKIPYVLDGGPCDAGIESTIIGFPDSVPTIYREGAIPKDHIEKLIGAVAVFAGKKIHAPGMSAVHYSPKTPLILCDDLEQVVRDHDHFRIGVITYGNYAVGVTADNQWILCKEQDWETAAHNLYAALHEMDERNYELILAKTFPEAGLGSALNDRLRRAAMKGATNDNRTGN
ncbi:MAG: threonylcarbamoyl-AMP synthase [Chitinophagaceae bacterium]|nr:threonylcarbamoyl-AMP synthase [Chitinophagaceae bacterium]